MIQLRDFQQESIDSLYQWFCDEKGNPLVVAPTGSGKSIINAEFIRSAVQTYPQTRIVSVTHVQELIRQNYQALIRMWPDAPAGIYSAGLGKKQIGSQIIFAGIQSIARQVERLGSVDLVIVDEAHLIPRKSSTLYGQFFEALRGENPDLRVIGLTATPFRLDSGMLHSGKDALFDGIAYNIPIPLLVDRGYLAPLVSKRPGTILDTAGIKKRGGDFVESAMAERFDDDDITKPAVAEIVEMGKDRRSWLVFCCTVAHAEHVRDEIRNYGISCEVVHGQLDKGQRARILESYKSGSIQCLTSVAVLTTGFDAPQTDLLAMLRPTQSTGLYMQIVGRGMRVAEGKENCLVLDFAENVMRHGPVDTINVVGGDGAIGDEAGEPGEAPSKTCPECSEIVAIYAKECPGCGFEFPPPEVKPKHERTASVVPVMAHGSKKVWYRVRDMSVARHTKPGARDSLRVEYLLQWHGSAVREWVCLGHEGPARTRAEKWWRANAHGRIPETVDEALERRSDIPKPVAVVTKREGKWTRVVECAFEEPEEDDGQVIA